VDRYFPSSWPHLEQVRAAIACLPDETSSAAEPTPAASSAAASSILPEVEVFLLTLVLTSMLRSGLNEPAAAFASTVAAVVRAHNRRSLDLLASKAYFYLSLAFERVGRLDTVRPTLLALYRTASLHRDQLCEATLTNLILRNYIHYNLIDQAQAFAAKTTFPEQASNNQYCRYLYYMGRLQATQLEYSDAYMRLLMAARKAPQDVGQGFVQGVHKLSIIVQLLMGEIPERSLFNQPGLRGPLKPYLALTQAVRAGDVQAFEAFVAENAQVFHADRNYTLVRRLGHNVLKTGLRKLSTSYSRISLVDVAAKLHLPSAKSAEYICAKAIR
jgi:26S proteasome regulatory subunit N3